MEDVREHFQKKASSFDHLYDEDHPLQRFLRPGLNARREFAVAVTADAVRALKCTPESVEVIFEDVKKSDWASGGKLASDAK